MSACRSCAPWCRRIASAYAARATPVSAPVPVPAPGAPIGGDVLLTRVLVGLVLALVVEDERRGARDESPRRRRPLPLPLARSASSPANPAAAAGALIVVVVVAELHNGESPTRRAGLTPVLVLVPAVPIAGVV